LISSDSKEVSQREGLPKIVLIVGMHLAATDLQSYIGAACNFATEAWCRSIDIASIEAWKNM